MLESIDLNRRVSFIRYIPNELSEEELEDLSDFEKDQIPTHTEFKDEAILKIVVLEDTFPEEAVLYKKPVKRLMAYVESLSDKKIYRIYFDDLQFEDELIRLKTGASAP